MSESAIAFDMASAAEDFAGEGRTIELFDGGDEGTGPERRMRLHTANGWHFSAIWGFGSYTANARAPEFLANRHPPTRSEDAEVMVWKGEGSALVLDHDTVVGWVSPTRFLAAVEAAERDDQDAIRETLLGTR